LPKYILDTNLIISRKFDPQNSPETTYYSSIVLFELMTACNDLKELRSYQAVWKITRRDGLLIVPTEEDWLTASRVSFALAQERKQQSGGKAPKLTAKAKQEIAMDCLLAVSAAREGITVLTNNRHDFDAIKRHLKRLTVATWAELIGNK
jgi:predicted nucleic acid-binding protein